MKFAVDAMGGDIGPKVTVAGSVKAVQELGVNLILVGDEEIISKELKKHDPSNKLNIEVIHAPENIDMHFPPSMVSRKKRNSSLWISTELVKDKKAEAVISAGNTGAAMAAGLFLLGRIKGIDRPAIGANLPNLKGTNTVIIDAGANVDCKPLNLFQFAIMGYEYGKAVMGIPNPAVGLLSIGEEDVKGNELTKETFRLLKETDINFIGNIEGRDIFTGKADIVICDGFIGNVVIKLSEGLVDAISKSLKKEIMQSITGKIGAFLLKNSFRRFQENFDYAEYGGAPLIGLNGISIICHGSSPPKAIKNAIKLAKTLSENRINEHIQSIIEDNVFLCNKNNIVISTEN